MNFRADRGKLPAMFGQQFLNRDLSFLHFGGIVLTLHGKSDFGLLEAVQHIALRHGVQPDVVDLTNRWTFFYINMDDPALGGLLALETDIFKVSSVPQGVEVAFQRRFVIDVAGVGENSGFDGFCRNAAIAMGNYLDNQILLPDSPSAKQEKRHHQAEEPSAVDTTTL